jgi:heme/copper-type cytochrome/quinol oxidase subunit 3
VPQPLISNGRLAVLVLLSAEAMLFAAFIGAFLIFKLSAPFWPPLNLPRLPIAVTWANTALLMASALTTKLAVRAARRQSGVRLWLAVTAVLGVTFLLVQGREWLRMEAHGLHLTSGNYGATFYVLIGLHAIHVAAAVTWLLAVTASVLLRGRQPGTRAAVELCAIYWYFVCTVWPLLFYLVYF